MVVGYVGAAFVHLLLGDGGQRSPGQLQSAHDGLKPLKGQRGAVVVHLYYPVINTQKAERSRVELLYTAGFT